jgi:hypothetical protein
VELGNRNCKRDVYIRVFVVDFAGYPSTGWDLIHFRLEGHGKDPPYTGGHRFWVSLWLKFLQTAVAVDNWEFVSSRQVPPDLTLRINAVPQIYKSELWLLPNSCSPRCTGSMIPRAPLNEPWSCNGLKDEGWQETARTCAYTRMCV